MNAHQNVSSQLFCFTVAVATLIIGFGASNSAASQIQNQSQLNFPSGIGEVGEPPKKSVLAAQEKAERAYEEGRYKDAFWYYRKDLAPVGDKFAQYMVGYMMENGLGTQRDVEGAAAWYLLAAERGHEDIVKVSMAYQQDLSPQQLSQVKQRTLTLKNEMGDRALIERLIRRDVDRLRNLTGTRVGSCNTATRVYRPRDPRGSVSVDRYCKTINARIEERTRYLGGYVEFGELELLPDEDDESDSEE